MKVKFLLLIFTYLITFQYISSNPSFEDYTFILVEKFKIGRKGKEINMILNSLISESILFTNSKRSYSQEIQRNRKSDVLIDKLNFNGDIMNEFAFKLKLDDTKLNNNKISGEFGLGIAKDKSNTLVDTLYEEKLISNKMLEIEVVEEDSKDALYLEFEPKINNYYFADLSSRDDFEDFFYSEGWICDLSHIIFGSNKKELSFNNSLEIKGKVVFDTRTKYIYIPKNYLKYIQRMWSIKGDGCKTILDSETEEKYFRCNLTAENDIYSMPSLYLIIGGYGYRLKPEDLFEKEGKHLNCLIRFIDEENDLWILGIPFLREYKLLFDYNNTRVGFSGENILNYKDEYDKWVAQMAEEDSRIFSENTIDAIILIIGTIIGICIILYVAYYLYKYWKGEKKHFQLDEEYDKKAQYN